MKEKMTETELAAKLAQLIRAWENRETGREMLAEAEKAVQRLTREIGQAHPAVRAMMTGAGANVFEVKPASVRYRTNKTYTPRALWGSQTIEYLKGIRVAVRASTAAKYFKLNQGVMLARLNALADEGAITRIKSGEGRVTPCYFQALGGKEEKK